MVDLVRRPLRGGVIFIDKVTVGIVNQVETGLAGDDRDGHTRPRRFFFRQVGLLLLLLLAFASIIILVMHDAILLYMTSFPPYD